MAGEDFQSIAGLVIFCLSILAVLVLVLRPCNLPLPKWRCLGGSTKVQIPYCWMPVVGVALMLICKSMTWADVGRGLVGDDSIQPYGIMVGDELQHVACARYMQIW